MFYVTLSAVTHLKSMRTCRKTDDVINAYYFSSLQVLHDYRPMQYPATNNMLSVRDLRFSNECCWRYKCSETSRCVITAINVSKARSVIFWNTLTNAFAKLRKETIRIVMSVCPSVCPSHGTTRLPREKVSWNFTFEYFSKMCPENSSFIKIW